MENQRQQSLNNLREIHAIAERLRLVNQAINTALGGFFGFMAFGGPWEAALFSFLVFGIDGCRHLILNEMRAAEVRSLLIAKQLGENSGNM